MSLPVDCSGKPACVTPDCPITSIAACALSHPIELFPVLGGLSSPSQCSGMALPAAGFKARSVAPAEL